jgi:hypothetical protein
MAGAYVLFAMHLLSYNRQAAALKSNILCYTRLGVLRRAGSPQRYRVLLDVARMASCAVMRTFAPVLQGMVVSLSCDWLRQHLLSIECHSL